ncbi:MAG: ParA family protein [Proteobacteria bacterium]|nr:MAG: ParA family protein [Pseudomonadota bacterium]
MKNKIVIANQKGGVGKTTTVLNLATTLVKAQRKKVLVVDMDPQGNATTGAGIDKLSVKHSIYDLLVSDIDARTAIVYSDSCKFDLIPANRNLAGAEIELVELTEREFRLKQILASIEDDYDLILIDCPPSLSLLTVNAFTAANYVIVPIQCEYYALEGLSDLLNTVNLMKSNLNPELEIIGILRTMYDKRNNLAQQVSTQLVDYFAQQVFYVSIPRSVRLAEAPSFGMSAVALDPDSAGSEAYHRLGREVIKRLRELHK